MHDALKTSAGDWTRRIVDTIDTCIDEDGQVHLPRLAQALATATSWRGCPRAEDFIAEGLAACYRRVVLADHQQNGYEALLILWPPRHATPIHDHDGLWGMEIMLDGVLEVEAFDLSLQDRPHLVSRDVSVIGIGDHLAFSEADYAHRCRNLSSNRAALSLHVYGGALDRYRSYHPEDEGRWSSKTHQTVREPARI
jgi:predicted metal-dependent enzyme (double-stranded beta helix superfamily)